MNKKLQYTTILLSAFAIMLANTASWAESWVAKGCLAGVPCVSGFNDKSDIKLSKSGSAACDANFMNQIQARAFLEAEREVIIADVVIRKADSILDLSCFDDLAGLLADYGGSTNVTSYDNCAEMNKVNFLSRCTNFAEDDLFFDFEDLLPFDPRVLPTKCTATDVYQEFIDLAENKDFGYVEFDTVKTGLKERNPSSDCGPPIQTGVNYVYDTSIEQGEGTVTETQYAMPEVTCTNPACHFDIDKKECVK